MKKIKNTLIVIALSMISVNVFSQSAAEKYLSKLPAIPEYICGASDETQTNWGSKMYALKTEISVLLADEKEAKEKAQANAKPRNDLATKADKVLKMIEENTADEKELNVAVAEMNDPTIAERTIEINEGIESIEKEVYAIIDKKQINLTTGSSTNTTSGVTKLDELEDVSLINLKNGDILIEKGGY